MIPSEWIQYLLEVSICLLAFYSLYHLLLKNESFFQLNRFYLLTTPVLSFIIPAVQIDLTSNARHAIVQFMQPAMEKGHRIEQLVQSNLQKSEAGLSLTVADLLIAVYAIGVMFMLVILLKGLFDVFQMIRSNHKQANGKATMVSTGKTVPAASFFSYIFWNSEEADKDHPVMFEHELVHVKQYHSLDVILIELLVIFKWFNPLIYFFRKQLRLTHEYIADSFVANQIGSKSDYVQTLLRQSGNHSMPLVNTFNGQLMHRLRRLSMRPSAKLAMLKYVLIVPLFAILMGLFSFNFTDRSAFNLGLETIGQRMETATTYPLLELTGYKKPGPFVDWAGKKIPLIEISDQKEIQFPMHVFSEKEFDNFQLEPPIVKDRKGDQLELKLARISVTASNFSDFYNLECENNDLSCLSEALIDMPSQSSIQLVFRDRDERQFYCILTDKNKAMYVPSSAIIIDPFIFDKPETLLSYGVDKMSRETAGYEFMWGPYLIFKVDQDLDFDNYYVSPEQIKNALQHMPALAPTHGGLFERFSFEIVQVRLNDDAKTINVTADEKDEKGYQKNEGLKALIESIGVNDIIYVEKILLGNGHEIGSFNFKVVENPSEFRKRRKWNMAGFNFNSNGRGQRMQSVVNDVQDNYHLQWGTLNIPLEFYAMPNAYRGKVEVQLEALKDVINFPIELYKNDQLQSPDELYRFLKITSMDPLRSNLNVISSFSQSGPIQLPKSSVNLMQQDLQNGISLTIMGSLGDLSINALTIQVLDPEGPYSPNHMATPMARAHKGGLYHFQIVQNVGDRKSFLKIDTTREESRDIIGMYSDKEKYDVIHIPDFKTTRRLISPDMRAVDSEPKSFDSDLLDTRYLSELPLENSDGLYLKWGRMLADPNSGNYSTKEFRYSSVFGLQLFHKGESLNISQFEMKVFSGDKLTHHYQIKEDEVTSYRSSNLNPVVRKALQGLQSRGSIYLSDIVVSRDGEDLLVPQDFSFVVE